VRLAITAQALLAPASLMTIHARLARVPRARWNQHHNHACLHTTRRSAKFKLTARQKCDSIEIGCQKAASHVMLRHDAFQTGYRIRANNPEPANGPLSGTGTTTSVHRWAFPAPNLPAPFPREPCKHQIRNRHIRQSNK